MPEYLSPGVYVEEVATGAVPIQGVGTSTAGFLGRTERGPEETRQINSFAEFERLYGEFAHYKAGGRLESTYTAYAVEGFFRNGGNRCVVGRIVPSETPTASANLANGEAPAEIPPPAFERDAVDFGTVALGDEETTSVTVTNPAGGEAIRGDAIDVVVDDPDNPGDFRAETTFDGEELGAGDSLTVDVTFAPEDAGAVGRLRSATLAVSYFPRGELRAELVGDAADLDEATHTLGTDALREDAGTVIVGEDADVTVTIQNLTDADVPDGNVDIDVTEDAHGDFSVTTGLGAPVPANGSADVTVSFAPNDAPDAARTARLTVTEGGTPQFEVTLVGEATGALAPATDEVAFGTVPPAGSRIRRVEFTNEGQADIALADVQLAVTGTGADEFEVDVEATTDPVGTGDTVTVVVEFTAEVADTRTVTLALATPAGEPLSTVTLTANAGPTSVEAIGPGVWGNNIAVIVGESELSTPQNPLFELTLRYWAEDAAVANARLHDADPNHRDVPRPDREEVYENLSPDQSSPDYYPDTVNAASTLVRLERKAPGIPATGDPVWLSAMFTDEETNEEGLTIDDFEGRQEAGDRTGFAALAAEDEVAIVCVPDQHSVGALAAPLTELLISHCEDLEDRFAVLQTPRRPGPVTGIRPPRPSEYAAVYYPWIKVDQRSVVPPSGHVAGIYARSDEERGVYKAPANEIVRGAQALEPDITKGEQDTLNPRGVNCLRSFPGRGIRVWGARTMASNAQWRYINVRRLFIFVEESIEESTQWVVFEPNDERLWARVRQSVSDFLTTVWRDGALAGSTQEEAFFVNCDRTTMTQAEIDQGKLIVEVGLAPVKPAEFVIFRFSQFTATSEVS